MKRLPGILAITAVLALCSLYFFPLWKVTLIAPQYPDGVSMHIYINKIGGDTPGTLQNINILNHYIGMAKIEPESIPELTYFPYVVAALAFMGLLAALVNKPWLYLTWFLIFLTLGILGIYDFYLWTYDYGHNLDPNAPIQVPGQTYQPPLIGSKMLLNFKSTSWPGVGGTGMGIAIFLSFLAWFFRRRY